MPKSNKREKKSRQAETPEALLAQCPEKMTCGKDKDRVKITYNQEVEFKLALNVSGENRVGSGQLGFDFMMANDIANGSKYRYELTEDLWKYFQKFRVMQRQKEMGRDNLVLSSGLIIDTGLGAERKSKRLRDFLIMARPSLPFLTEYLRNWELRVEGGRTTAKFNNSKHAANDANPFLNRVEIVMHTVDRGPPDFDRLPEPYKTMLADAFDAAAWFPGYRTISTREKLLADTRYGTPKGEKLKVIVEWARDIGVGENFVGDKNDILEFESEVKYIYHGDVDVKKRPEKIGMTRDDILQISKTVLGRERQMFMEFFYRYQQLKGLDDCAIKGIYTSKSTPGILQLEPILERGGPELDKAIVKLRKDGFQTFPGLKTG